MARAKPGLAYNVYSADCPTRTVLDIVADKWTSLVMVALVPGTKRFQQLKREIGGITQKMLTQTLRSLERNGLVERRAYPTVPPRVEYTLTRLGHTLTDSLQALQDWSVAHVGEIQRARARMDARTPPLRAAEVTHVARIY
jgi:DNA-binding HxlR family transcriptional regulator